MPVKDSLQSGKTEDDQEPLPAETSGAAQIANGEEIETPVEADVQARAKHEFETQREIPKSCTKAIVSVNGKDVDEVPLTSHERAA